MFVKFHGLLGLPKFMPSFIAIAGNFQMHFKLLRIAKHHVLQFAVISAPTLPQQYMMIFFPNFQQCPLYGSTLNSTRKCCV